MAYHVYISNSGSNFFSHFLMDEDSGALEPQPNIELEDSPGAVAVRPDGTQMFVALRSVQKLASYAVDGEKGTLAKLAETSLEEGPPYLYLDDTGAFFAVVVLWVGSGWRARRGCGRCDFGRAAADDPHRNTRPQHPDRPLKPLCLCAAHQPVQRDISVLL